MPMDLGALAILADETRYQMYTFIREARRPVTREQVAEAAGISRKLAAFHLDKLVDAGLLAASYAPASTGARGGRPPKLYEPASAGLQVSIPARQHGELAGILVDAVLGQAPGEDAGQAAGRAARSRGRVLGSAVREQARSGRIGPERALTMAWSAMREWGFEPYRTEPGGLRPRNCPFQPFSVSATELVCGLNHAFLAGLLDGLGTSAVRAVLDPRPGECCVELRTVA